ncbi:MAG: riboflavin synthase [Gemmatimonadales bacterium]
MFTGIVTEIGRVQELRSAAGGIELSILCSYGDLQPGESVAVDGACLTVESADPRAFKVHLVRTSLDRTRFTGYTPGQRVNLERALRVGDRLGGHLVQGHVDGIGTIEELIDRHDVRILDLRVPKDVSRVSVPLGSIAVDGVSLTVNAKPAPTLIQISLIPFTLQHTTLGERRVGDRVHLEADTIGKYVRALMKKREQ